MDRLASTNHIEQQFTKLMVSAFKDYISKDFLHFIKVMAALSGFFKRANLGY